MKRCLLWLPILSFLLVACAGSRPETSDVSTGAPASNGNIADQVQAAVRWSALEQEEWVDEPVFNGSLHLVQAGKAHLQSIILVHGLGDRGILDWEQVLPSLAESYHVIAIDLPGFGGSDQQQVQYAPQKYAQLVDWVARQYAHGPVIVIGHSMGAAVSLRYAYDQPASVSRLIMVDTAGILQRTVFIRYLAKTPDSYEWSAPYQASFPSLDKLFKKVARKADDWTRSLLVMMDRMPDVPQMMMSNGLARKYLYKDRSSMNAALGLVYEDFSGVVREVDVPTHIIWGEDDSVAPLRTGKLLANLMPDAELHVINGAGHVPMTDQPAEFMRLLTYSLETAPNARQAQQRLKSIETEGLVEDVALCDGQDNKLYTGHYRVIQLRNCQGVEFRDLVAESIELVNSGVSMENVQLRSPGTGLKVSNSVVTATLLQVEADTGMVIDTSYLDLAGADFVTREAFVEIRHDSRLYFSLSRSVQGHQLKDLQGVSIGAELNLN